MLPPPMGVNLNTKEVVVQANWEKACARYNQAVVGPDSGTWASLCLRAFYYYYFFLIIKNV
jgi:hypothetical protein